MSINLSNVSSSIPKALRLPEPLEHHLVSVVRIELQQPTLINVTEKVILPVLVIFSENQQLSALYPSSRDMRCD